MKKIPPNARLYCINAPRQDGIGCERMAEEAILGGADVFQLRLKDISDKELLEKACAVSEICKKLRALFIVNDRPDIALLCGADGVHLGQNDLPIGQVRKILGDKFIIGISAYTVAEAKQAESEGADYIGVGAVFATPTKKDCAAAGLDLIARVRKTVKIPVVAIGGIDETNAADCLRAGASMCAVVRAVCGSQNIRSAAERLKRVLTL